MHWTRADLVKLKLPDLKALCKENYSKLNKAQLIQCLQDNDSDSSTDRQQSQPPAQHGYQPVSSTCSRPDLPTQKPFTTSNGLTDVKHSKSQIGTEITRENPAAGSQRARKLEQVNPDPLSLHPVDTMRHAGKAAVTSTCPNSASRGPSALILPAINKESPSQASEQGRSLFSNVGLVAADNTIGIEHFGSRKTASHKSRITMRETVQQAARPRCLLSEKSVPNGHSHKKARLDDADDSAKRRQRRCKIYLKPSDKVHRSTPVTLAHSSTAGIKSGREAMSLDECHTSSDRKKYLESSFLPAGIVSPDLGEGFAVAMRFAISRLCISGQFAQIDKAQRVSRDIWKLTCGEESVFVLEQTGESLGSTLRHDWAAFAEGHQSMHDSIRTKMDDEFPQGIAKGFKGDRKLAQRFVLAGCAGESFCGPKLRLHQLDAESLGKTGAQVPAQSDRGYTFATGAEATDMIAPEDDDTLRPVPSWMKRVQLYLPELVPREKHAVCSQQAQTGRVRAHGLSSGLSDSAEIHGTH